MPYYQIVSPNLRWQVKADSPEEAHTKMHSLAGMVMRQRRAGQGDMSVRFIKDLHTSISAVLRNKFEVKEIPACEARYV